MAMTRLGIVLLLAGCAAPVVPPCVTEDGAGPCYWNAQERGNGTGRSFTVHADQTVTYWSE